MNGSIDDKETEIMPVFNLAIPREVSGVESKFLNPMKSWPETGLWDKAARELAEKFITNFEKYTDNELGKKLVSAGPSIAMNCCKDLICAKNDQPAPDFSKNRSVFENGGSVLFTCLDFPHLSFSLRMDCPPYYLSNFLASSHITFISSRLMVLSDLP